EARPANDWARMVPLLERTLDLSVQRAAYFPEFADPMDFFVDASDEGMTAAQVDAVFAELRAALVPLVDAVAAALAAGVGARLERWTALAPAAVAATWFGGVWFLALMLAACVVLAFEWGAMSAPKAPRPVGFAVALAVVAAVVSAYFGVMSVAFVTFVFGAAAAGLLARKRGQQAVDAAYGVLYLGWPSILLIWLR
ncbi:MAG: hypothetical protein ACK4M6_16260, partial [Hyphomonas sp.]